MKTIAALLLILFTPRAQAMDHRSQFGFGGALGGAFAAPWANETFRNAVSPAVPAMSAWFRYVPGTPEVGWEISYNYFGLGTMNLKVNTAVVSFFSRQNPWGSFHPFYAVGFGYAHSTNRFATGDAGTWDDPVFKLTAGIDFELNPRTDLGFQLNHYSIFKDTASQQNIHALTPVLTLTYYLGKPEKFPVVSAPKDAVPPGVTPLPKAQTAPTVQPKKRPGKTPPNADSVDH
jgi:hypothetical protein